MLWPRRARRRVPTDRGGVAVADAPFEEHGCPGLQGLVSGISTARVRCVLDLGPAMPGNLALYQRFAEHICFADLFRDLGGVPAPGATVLSPETVSDRLPALSATYDLVVAWDVLDHLEPAAARLLIDRLAACSRPGTGLYVTVSMSSAVPSRPSRFEILDDGERVAEHPRTLETRPGPTLTPAEVARRLAPFETARAVVLKRGVRELVAVLPQPRADAT